MAYPKNPKLPKPGHTVEVKTHDPEEAIVAGICVASDIKSIAVRISDNRTRVLRWDEVVRVDVFGEP